MEEQKGNIRNITSDSRAQIASLKEKMMKYWIKERHNPQLGVYYVACGKLSKKDAKSMEKALYGDNYMLPFDSVGAYQAKIEALKAEGKRVQ